MSGTRLVTAEEFIRMGEGRRELIRGRVVEMTPIGVLHGRVTIRLGVLLSLHLGSDRTWLVSGGDPGCVIERHPDTVRAPDIAVFRADRLEGHDQSRYAPFAPEIAMEVTYPDDSPHEVREKALMWLSSGSRLAWVVDPERRTVTVYAPGVEPRELTEPDTLDGGDVLSGLAIPVRAIFE